MVNPVAGIDHHRAAQIGDVVFGAFDLKAGACGSRYNLCSDVRLGPEIPVQAGVLGTESSRLLRGYFAARRSPSASTPI